MQTNYNTTRGGEEKRKGRREREEEREGRKEKTGDCRRKPPAHTERMTGPRPSFNFYPSHFLPKKQDYNNLPKLTQGFNQRWSDTPKHKSPNPYLSEVVKVPRCVLMTSSSSSFRGISSGRT